MQPASAAEKQPQPRSSFVRKLHELLSSEQHPEFLHWLNNDTFAITSVDVNARIALRPQWEFRSLSSFIRQLSYYAFKRLSDRRRSAERRSSVPAFIVFTHPSGNFVRDDISKTSNIQRKMRTRKPSGKSKRKGSSASSAGAGVYEPDLDDRSPSPGEAFEGFGDEKPSEVQLGLQQYQLAPWNAIDQGRTIRSSPRSLPPPNLPPHIPLTSHINLREVPASFETTAYPSPVSGPPTSTFFPTSNYYPPQHEQQQHEQPVYYYASAAPAAPIHHSSFSTYAANELPPIRALTSGLVAPPSPPPEPYHHYHSNGRVDERPPHDEEEQTPSPMPVHASIPAPQPIALPSVAVLEQHEYYASSPPRPHNAYYPVQQHHHIPPSYGSPAGDHKSAFYHLSGQSDMGYPAAAMTAVSHA